MTIVYYAPETNNIVTITPTSFLDYAYKVEYMLPGKSESTVSFITAKVYTDALKYLVKLGPLE